MTGNLNMGMKNILNIDTLNDYTDNSEKDRDLKSVVNKQYLNTHFLKIMGKGDYDFNLGGQIIKNCEPYYDGLFDDNSLVSKAFVDAKIAKLPKPATDVLKTDGSKAMNGNLDMANHSIINLKDPKPSDASYAASVNFVNNTVNHSNTIINGVIDKKIKESEEKSIQTVNQENVFEKVMDDDEFKEDDDDIHKIGVQNKDFHSINKKTYEFKIDYDPDEGDGEYSARLSIDLIYLPTGSYTMVYQMYIDDGLTVIQIDASSGTLTVGKINSKINGTNTRSIIHFTKNSISSGFDDLDLDIKLKGKTDLKTTIYVVVYGVKGTVNDVDVKIWDRVYYYDGSNINFEVPIDMNNNKIIGLQNGTGDKHAVNKRQLDTLMKLYYSNYDLRCTKNNILFNNSNKTYINLPKGLYLINYNLPIKMSSDYDSNGGIVLKPSGITNFYYDNIAKSTKFNAFKTNIYLFETNNNLKISTYGSGIEFNTISHLDRYIIIYKLFDDLP